MVSSRRKTCPKAQAAHDNLPKSSKCNLNVRTLFASRRSSTSPFSCSACWKETVGDEICALSWRPWFASNQRTIAIVINARITNWFVFVSATSILPKSNECSSRPHQTKLSRCPSICTRFMNFFGRLLLCQLTKFVHQALCAKTCPKEHVGKNRSVVRRVHVRA